MGAPGVDEDQLNYAQAWQFGVASVLATWFTLQTGDMAYNCVACGGSQKMADANDAWMPWKESLMDQRLQFLSAYQRDEATVQARRFSPR